jgi:hypothetical protein
MKPQDIANEKDRILPEHVQAQAIEALQLQLKLERSLLEISEEISDLKRRGQKYKQSDPSETWSSRWIAVPIAYLFPVEQREEWLGDLYESNWVLLHKNYPRWLVNLIDVGRTMVLIASALQIKVSDLFPLQVRSIK